MSRYIRPRVTGASIFFTVCLADRRSDLLVRHVDVLRAAVRATMAERPFVIDAFVVLPDHFHCVWSLPRGDAEYSHRMAAIKARFSRNIRRAGFTPPCHDRAVLQRSGGERFGRAMPMAGGGVNPALRKGQTGIWQKRFWEHHIRTEWDFANHVRYCHINPVKHGLVAAPEDWLYSSLHRIRP
ncbi:transposase [Pseudooceanicola sediminis]|uniref:Transposase n=1 Tax=Pseudooceanicola sediminis TaxID=2211117 RepID=A0A399IYD2_9RHOB|nr:transposase [Pseudooceanicola sediminis]|tara:strand:- start:205162 stop:205710 length:549 start_codon:yes stop_codon:yes gene_type:complete